MEFKIGDVVRLKSGSPKMTICGIGKYAYLDHEQVCCIWFDGLQKRTEVFEKEVLTIE